MQKLRRHHKSRDVVLYGEQLESDVVDRAVKEIGRADMLLIMGTSLAVYPAAGLIDYFRAASLCSSINPPRPTTAGPARDKRGRGQNAESGRRIMGLEV
jgi:NAD-dependent SIR2 family protein deacetylase